MKCELYLRYMSFKIDMTERFKIWIKSFTKHGEYSSSNGTLNPCNLKHNFQKRLVHIYIIQLLNVKKIVSDVHMI